MQSFLQAGVGHDFGRVSVNALRESVVSLAEIGGLAWLHDDTVGETGCDVSIGTPTTVIKLPSLCYKACTERHEAVHATDLKPCCTRANKEYNKASTDDKKQAVQDKMNKWVLDNRDYLECRGYAESIRCGEEFLAAHCRGPSPNQVSENPASGEKQEVAAAPNAGTEAADSGKGSEETLVSDRLEEARLGEDKPADLPSQPGICCLTVAEYVRKHKIHHDQWCASKRRLSACPFPV